MFTREDDWSRSFSPACDRVRGYLGAVVDILMVDGNTAIGQGALRASSGSEIARRKTLLTVT